MAIVKGNNNQGPNNQPIVMAMKEGCTVGRGGVRRQFIFPIKIEWN
jgi:hypothetical protein